MADPQGPTHDSLNEVAHNLHLALLSLAQAINLYRQTPHTPIAEAHEADFDAIIANHALHRAEYLSICASAAHTNPPQLSTHVPWLQLQLAERDVECVVLRLRAARSLVGGVSAQRCEMDVDRLLNTREAEVEEAVRRMLEVEEEEEEEEEVRATQGEAGPRQGGVDSWLAELP